MPHSGLLAKLQLSVLLVLAGLYGAGAEAADAGLLPLWHIDSGKSDIYLLGSIHALKARHYPLPGRMERVFEDADGIVVEVDLTSLSQYDMTHVMRELGYYPASQTLQGQLTPETLGLLKAFLAARGIPFSEVSRIRPWLLSLNLGVQELLALGYQPSLGVDQYFLDRATEAGKPIEQLESYREQIELLAADPPQVQDIALRASLEEFDEMEGLVEAMIEAWQQGDTARMFEISRQSATKYPELASQSRRIIDDRNRMMAERIRGYANRQGTWLIIIGALHMAGEAGIIALLQETYEVEQLDPGR